MKRKERENSLRPLISEAHCRTLYLPTSLVVRSPTGTVWPIKLTWPYLILDHPFNHCFLPYLYFHLFRSRFKIWRLLPKIFSGLQRDLTPQGICLMNLIVVIMKFLTAVCISFLTISWNLGSGSRTSHYYILHHFKPLHAVSKQCRLTLLSITSLRRYLMPLLITAPHRRDKRT